MWTQHHTCVIFSHGARYKYAHCTAVDIDRGTPPQSIQAAPRYGSFRRRPSDYTLDSCYDSHKTQWMHVQQHSCRQRDVAPLSDCAVTCAGTAGASEYELHQQQTIREMHVYKSDVQA